MKIGLVKNIAVDLGPEISKMYYIGKIVLEKPSCVIGENGVEVWPLRCQFLGNFSSLLQLIQQMINETFPHKWFKPRWYRMVVCIPDTTTEVEMRAYRDACEQAGAIDVYLIRRSDALSVAPRDKTMGKEPIWGAAFAVEHIDKCPFLYR